MTDEIQQPVTTEPIPDPITSAEPVAPAPLEPISAQSAFNALTQIIGSRPHNPDATLFNKMHDALDHILAFIRQKYAQEVAALKDKIDKIEK